MPPPAQVRSRDQDAPPSGSSAGQSYGQFSEDGTEYRITDYRTPRPWANIIANPRIGLAVSQTGSGFTWIDNSQLAALTRWEQDLARDCSGKFLYVRDADSGEVWSLSPAPVWPAFETYECRHGLGYTTFVTEFAGIRADWTLLVHSTETMELWRVELHNRTDRVRRLELCAYLEWNCGVAPSPRREFHKLFLETEFDSKRRAIFARNHMWEVPSVRWGHWNTSFPYVSALACTERVLSAQGDKAAFLGRYGGLGAPEAVSQDVWRVHFGRHADPIAALRSTVEIAAMQSRRIGYCIAASGSRGETHDLIERHLKLDLIDQSLADVKTAWKERLAEHRVETPEPSLNYVVNDWGRYQAISGRLWGRCGYYQQSGAFGFRDQLQDSQVWLTIEPRRCREQIRLHAGRQFRDGSVYHWWHPLTEQGHVTKMTDDLLWLAFVIPNYIKETGDFSVLNDRAPYLDDAHTLGPGNNDRAGGAPGPGAEEHGWPLLDHVLRAFNRVFKRTSPRGLPYIGAGDWNDGLSACGLEERGESIWLAQFLAGLLQDWSELLRRAQAGGIAWPATSGGEKFEALDTAADFARRREKLIAAVNEHAWDGEWYFRATLDDGSRLGSRENRAGRIFLNAQTWAILNDVAPPERAQRCWSAVREHLLTDAGPLLLAPAFEVPDERIGYITRYAPGLRENGGVYTHAATWAIAAACKMRDRETVGRLLTAINPALKDPERYWAEPYVLPGNVDGPDSPHFGRAGWTWYTGSAQWLHRVVTAWVLGVRPDWNGLKIEPCLPAGWTKARMVRPWRGGRYDVSIRQASGANTGTHTVMLDGRRRRDAEIPAPERPGERHEVRVEPD